MTGLIKGLMITAGHHSMPRHNSTDLPVTAVMLLCSLLISGQPTRAVAAPESGGAAGEIARCSTESALAQGGDVAGLSPHRLPAVEIAEEDADLSAASSGSPAADGWDPPQHSISPRGAPLLPLDQPPQLSRAL